MEQNILSATQVVILGDKLQELKNEIEKLLNSSIEDAKPVDLEKPIGRISRMDAMLDQNMAKANKESLSLRLRQINASLNDFKNQKYGLCRLCKNSIGFKRLNARPEAPFCINCQNKIEQKNRSSKH